jgi:hypothetical protein
VHKVIGFDGWTAGSHHFQRLVEAFTRRGFELTLLHLGSWGNEKGRPSEESIGSLPVRDIAYYSGLSLAEILDRERPAAVILLSTEAFAHRAFMRYCRQRGIPTLHLFHGLQQLMDAAPLRTKALRRMWLMRRHLLKAVRHFWPVYARSLYDTRASLRDWLDFAHDLFTRARAARRGRVARDSLADRACVYIESEARYAVKTYGYAPEQVTVVGNPDLLSFGMAPRLIGSRLCAPSGDTGLRHVVYIETNLVHYGALFDSTAQFIDHVLATRDHLSRLGRALVFKPHPSTDADVVAALSAAGVLVCSREEFIPNLERACACITEPSSAALIPALMGLPLLLAQYGLLAGQIFGDLISSYPRARPLEDLNSLGAALSEQTCVEIERTRLWIEQTTGPMPPEGMPGRVAAALETLLDGPAVQRELDTVEQLP